ncbi:hypothetical protein AKO1_014094 [Acrasis kona]|uniref:Nucleolar protein 10 n=1 Tax=Acrasis kona TaxID=1008807 RepID=A0AAW2Z1Y6_9EUKA
MDAKRLLRELQTKRAEKQGRRANQKSNKQQPQLKTQINTTDNNIVSRNYGIQVYDLEGKKTIEQMLRRSNLKKRYNEEVKNYTNLIDDLEFPIATSCVRLTGDENHLWATGTYPPQIRCFLLDQLTMKFKRHLDTEALKIVPLTTDYKKIAVLGVNRTIEVHAQWGTYDKFRIPREGRDMTYHAPSCELLICGSGDELYRFDLESGLFRRPVRYASGALAANAVRINPVHQLVAVGCENGYVECIDPRVQEVVGITHAAEHINAFLKNAVTKYSSTVNRLEYDPSNGITMAIGTDAGHVGIFDLRKDGCINVKDHQYESPIISLAFHDLTKNIISADERIVKIWDRESSDVLVNLEMPAPITDCLAIPNSGMVMVASERSKIKPFYIPLLGPAPKWCSFVDTVTEELDDIKKFSLQQDFKFLTVDQVVELGLQELFGTEMLRPHLHGYFVKMNLYKKALEEKGRPEENVKTDQVMDANADERISTNRIEKELVDQVKDKGYKSKDEKIETVDDSRFAFLLNDDEDFQVDDKTLHKKNRLREKQIMKKKYGDEVDVNDEEEDVQDEQYDIQKEYELDEDEDDGLRPIHSGSASFVGGTGLDLKKNNQNKSFADRLNGGDDESEEEEGRSAKRFKSNNNNNQGQDRRRVGGLFKRRK